jgi:hypothetical protein
MSAASAPVAISEAAAEIPINKRFIAILQPKNYLSR